MKKKHTFQAWWRAFCIWQKLGFLPWHKPGKALKKRSGGDFYKGAFDSIPFLNDDAKRTFVHLLIRPGYMMRDYIRGQHERYLAPLTALIIFYAFFALVSSMLSPYQMDKPEVPGWAERVSDAESSGHAVDEWGLHLVQLLGKGKVYLHLDQLPEEVDTRHEQIIAALESSLRSHGITLFIGQFFLLWLAASVVLRKHGLGMSACAAVSAYVLCQFCFFMLFALLLSLGGSGEIKNILKLVLLTWDYQQLLGLSVKKSFWLSFRTILWSGIWALLLIVLGVALVSAVAYFQTV